MDESPNYDIPAGVVVNLVAGVLSRKMHIPSENLYHYTSFDGLQGILQSHTLWATDTRFFNDTTERAFAEAAMVAFLKSVERDCELAFLEMLKDCISPTFGSTFATCFCENGDLLSMWRGYGSEDGYSIGFEGNALRGLLKPTFETFGKVMYGSDFAPIVNEFRELCEHMKKKREPAVTTQDKHGVMGCFAQMLVLVKHPAFQEEQEWRIVIPRQPIDKVHFRSGPYGPKPYVRVPVIQDDGGEMRHAKLPIRQIIVGPTAKSPVAEDVVNQMLEKYGYGDSVVVSSSAIPYRT